MDRRPRATPRAPSSRPLPVPSPNPGGATTPVATSSSSAGRPSTTTTTTTGTAMGSKPPRSSESYHAFAQREEAARILQSYERLSWYSYARCESLAQTRLHFRNLVAGFGPDDEAAHIDYTEDLTPLPSKREEAAGVKASRKGKERASLSGAGVNGGGGGGAGGSPARDGEGIATPSSAGKKKKRRSEG
ncbi:hypothetical protein KC367_g5204 [Hortaea werneckii]|nr:hypothetical protein KC367_g5204 [Hortaea werneckii]